MLPAVVDAPSTVDPLVVAMAGGAGGLIVGLMSVGAQLWIARQARTAEKTRRDEDKKDEETRRKDDRAQAEREALLARREPHYAAALAALSELRANVETWLGQVSHAVTGFEFKEGLDAGHDMRPRIGVLDPSLIDALVQSHMTELPKAATRYTELLSSTLGALSLASTVGSQAVRDAVQVFINAAFSWAGEVGPSWQTEVQTGITTVVPGSVVATKTHEQLTQLFRVAGQLEQTLRVELGFEPGATTA